MSNSSLISSEQALDEYFTALLDDDIQLAEPIYPEEMVPLANNELEPELKIKSETNDFRDHRVEVVAPNLEDVERLLQQIEASNPVDELNLEEILDQNTLQIAAAKPPKVAEELQDWPVDEAVVDNIVEDIVEQPTHAEAITIDNPVLEPAMVSQETALATEPTVKLATEIEPETKASGGQLGVWHSTQRVDDFQVLYFDVNGMMFAVPLDELGGIHRLGELSHLIGRPSWYLGLQTSKESQLDVVDTAEWVMSEKLSDGSHKEQYQYIVMLGESMWGLASTDLKGTELLNTDKVRWRETAGKRPWLAGMVKEKMCALIHVEALVAMLNAGLDVKALNK